MRTPWAGERAASGGFSVVELLLVLSVTATIAALVAPLTAHTVDEVRARNAAEFLAGRLRLARQQAVGSRRATAVVFDQVGATWSLRVCTDRNANGVRRADIAAGLDRCIEGPHAIDELFSGMALVVDPALTGPAGEPGSPDPVRFGTSDMASCTPLGSCTAGTVFLQSARGSQYAVRVGNITGRTRVLRYETGASQWVSE
jgi:type II secretory pathway pseudopilin PulG